MEIDEAHPSSVSNGAFNYVVTAQKPTRVVTSLVGNFVSSDSLNLIVGYGVFRTGSKLMRVQPLLA